MVRERTRQLELQPEINQITLTDLSPIVEAANSSNEPIIIYGKGITGIDECFRDLPGWFEKLDGQRSVAAFHYEGLYFEQPESKQEESVLIIGPVFEFDNEHFEGVVRNIAAHTSGPVIFLVPVWPTTGKLELLKKWEKKKRHFEVDPESVQTLSHEGILKLAPKPKHELRQVIPPYGDNGA